VKAERLKFKEKFFKVIWKWAFESRRKHLPRYPLYPDEKIRMPAPIGFIKWQSVQKLRFARHSS